MAEGEATDRATEVGSREAGISDAALLTARAAAKRDNAIAGFFDALCELAREGTRFLRLAIDQEDAARERRSA